MDEFCTQAAEFRHEVARQETSRPARFVFVGGTGRCGTTVLRRALLRHPDTAGLPFALRIVCDPDGLADFYVSSAAAWSPYQAHRRLARLECFLRELAHESLWHRITGNLLGLFDPRGRRLSPRYYHGWNLARHLPDYERHVDGLVRKLTDFEFPASWYGTPGYRVRPHLRHPQSLSRQELAYILGDFLRTLLDDYLARAGAAVYVDDDTWNVLFAREIVDMLPEAKIIHIYRDPRDVAASFARQRWAPDDRSEAARWYLALIERWFEVRTELAAASYREVRFERLVADPEGTLRELCAFIGLLFCESMAEVVSMADAHVGRWRQEFSAREERAIQEMLGAVVERLGYEAI